MNSTNNANQHQHYQPPSHSGIHPYNDAPNQSVNTSQSPLRSNRQGDTTVNTEGPRHLSTTHYNDVTNPFNNRP